MEKKLHWETTLGRLELTIQRFLDGQKLVAPFSCSAEVACRDYSLLLERVITDFGADVSLYYDYIDAEHQSLEDQRSAKELDTRHF